MITARANLPQTLWLEAIGPSGLNECRFVKLFPEEIGSEQYGAERNGLYNSCTDMNERFLIQSIHPNSIMYRYYE